MLFVDQPEVSENCSRNLQPAMIAGLTAHVRGNGSRRNAAITWHLRLFQEKLATKSRVSGPALSHCSSALVKRESPMTAGSSTVFDNRHLKSTSARIRANYIGQRHIRDRWVPGGY